MANEANPTNKTALLRISQWELKKTHIEYDADGREEFLYEARVGTLDGGKCMGTRMSYIGSTVQIENTVEFEATWQAAWDLAVP